MRLLAVAVAAAMLAGCGDETSGIGQPADGRTPVAANQKQRQPRQVAVGELPAEHIPAAVLNECHGEILGMARLSARVWLPDGTQLRVLGTMPDTLRVEYTQDRIDLLTGDRGVRFDRQRQKVQELTGTDATRLRALRQTDR